MTVTVGGKHVALFNEEGTVYAMEDACLHAGTSLGMGVLEGKCQVDTMPAGTYFAYAGELLKLHPPHLADEPIMAQIKRIGLESGKSFDF